MWWESQTGKESYKVLTENHIVGSGLFMEFVDSNNRYLKLNWEQNSLKNSPKYIRICYSLLPVIRPTFEEKYPLTDTTTHICYTSVLFWIYKKITGYLAGSAPNNTEHQKDGHHQLAIFTSSDVILSLGPSNLNTFMVLLKMCISISI